jgi:hypothetical protein
VGAVSDSYHLESNGASDLCRDKQGNLLEGTVITEDGIIRRFRNGLLDGDSYTPEGKRITQPAVEGPGHLEYWREGKLHRDQGLPAVSSRGFHYREWWVEGNQVRREDPEPSGESRLSVPGSGEDAPPEMVK